MYDVASIRNDFPILQRKVHGKPLVYLDNAATSQKPQQVIAALQTYYTRYNANIHRGPHTLAEEATTAYEAVREQMARFLRAPSPRGIVFTRNATEAINLFANAWGRANLKPGDQIVLTEMEHHSNLVPWQLIAKATGATLAFLPITEDGRLELSLLTRLLGARTKVVSVTLMSNVLGTINPVKELARAAHQVGALMVVDGAQGVPHLPVDVQQLECDVLAFSAHKMLGPTGVGVLWAREALLESMEPFLGGGEMISDVQLPSSTWNEIPWKFEAGTPNIADVIAFGEALKYLTRLGMDQVRAHKMELAAYAIKQLSAIKGITLYGPMQMSQRGGAVSFNLDGLHPHDVGTVLDAGGVAIRAGHHCAKPLMRRLGVAATARASFYVYNTTAEGDQLVEAIRKTQSFFNKRSSSSVRSRPSVPSIPSGRK